jgi:hypothetical protein
MAIFHYDPVDTYEKAIERHKRAIKRLKDLIKKLKVNKKLAVRKGESMVLRCQPAAIKRGSTLRGSRSTA